MWSVNLIPLVASYANFRLNIPNGEFVPSPCNPNYVWQGVGHQVKGGGGPRNPFGLAFKEHGFTWTEQLCKEDSDNDGKTNGEELGDPNCVWTKGSVPEKTTGLSHPGFCEPYNSTKCREINSLLDCAASEFECEAVDNDNDVIEVDLRLNETLVPGEVTTYMCQVLDLPVDRDYHLVATKPYITNINVMHHITVYGCKDDAMIESKHLLPSKCFMNRIPGCDDVIALWTVGNPGICYHKDAGFRVGKTGFKRVMIELHWNNPMKVTSYRDSSGIKFFLTPNLRPNDAGMFVIGTAELEIPPGLERHTESSTCSSECTRDNMHGRINIVGTLNHMHYLGMSAESRMVSHDDDVHRLSYEQTYSYDSPKFVIFDEPILMEPGYKLELSCHYRSTSRTVVTNYGEGTNDEMCYAFIMYYPKANWTGGDCISPWSDCGDCDYEALGDYTNPETAARNARLFSNCEPGYCKEGCLDVVRDIFQEPCFKGIHLKNQKASLKMENTPDVKLAIYDYMYRLDSCNAELAKEQCSKMDNPEVGAASCINTGPWTVFVYVAVIIFML